MLEFASLKFFTWAVHFSFVAQKQDNERRKTLCCKTRWNANDKLHSFMAFVSLEHA